MAKSHESSKGLHGAMKHLHKMHKGHEDHMRAHGGMSEKVKIPDPMKDARGERAGEGKKVTGELSRMRTMKNAGDTPSKPC